MAVAKLIPDKDRKILKRVLNRHPPRGLSKALESAASQGRGVMAQLDSHLLGSEACRTEYLVAYKRWVAQGTTQKGLAKLYAMATRYSDVAMLYEMEVLRTRHQTVKCPAGSPTERRLLPMVRY